MIVKTPIGYHIEFDSFEAFLCEYSPPDKWWYIRAYLKGSFHESDKSYVIGKEYETREDALKALDDWIDAVKSNGWTYKVVKTGEE
jgi:hypothetical protein